MDRRDGYLAKLDRANARLRSWTEPSGLKAIEERQANVVFGSAEAFTRTNRRESADLATKGWSRPAK